ncbi:tyrosine-type recombinase/integrase [Terrabacter terrigena]|uniref:Tyrosine-type recombinase/integrase n=1 Tax=Terrabacter terrigena TaxID=574718 RepID=A0ABW3MUM2_9MICO
MAHLSLRHRPQASGAEPVPRRPHPGNPTCHDRGAPCHDLRHTCVTLLLTEGVAPHIVQEIVGHSAMIDVTMTIYAHTSLDEKRKALQLLGERLA